MILQCSNKKIYLLLRRLELYRVHPRYTKAILRLICVVMGVPQVRGHFAESMKIYNYGFAKYAFKAFAPANQKQGVVKVRKGIATEVEVITQKALGVSIEKGKDKNFWVETKLNPEVTAPVKENQKLGELLLYRDDQIQASVDLVAKQPIARSGVLDQMTRTLKEVIGF